MAYNLEISPEADEIFAKLAKKSKKQLEAINMKIGQILANPHHFKELRGNMQRIRRVHIEKSFVLTYEILEKEKTVRILDYEHHDNIY